MVDEEMELELLKQVILEMLEEMEISYENLYTLLEYIKSL